MPNKEIEQKLKTAVEHSVPDVLDQVLSKCEQQKGSIIEMENTKKKRPLKTAILSAAAAFLLLFGTVTGVIQYQKETAIDSTISFDVNPSVQLQVNRNERVLSATALNEDGQEILNDMDFKNTDLDVAVNALIGSMLKHGYLSDLQNSILLSVENQDSAKAQQLQVRLVEEIDSLLGASTIDAAILSQTVTKDSKSQSLTETYGISLGKATLIESILQQNQLLSAEGLVPLTINELNLLTVSKQLSLPDISATGKPSEKAYVGEDAAKKSALKHANVTEAQVSKLEISLDLEDHVMIYDIEFKANGNEYEYEIDALSGVVIKCEIDKEDDDSKKPEGNKTSYIGAEKAKTAALAHAGLAGKEVSFTKVEFDRDDGVSLYEVKFRYENTKYEYEINALTGAVIQHESEQKRDLFNSNKTDSNSSQEKIPTVFIGIEQAQNIALKHAGLSGKQVSFEKIELDQDDDDPAVYELEFSYEQTEYEYEIDALTGAVLQYESELDD